MKLSLQTRQIPQVNHRRLIGGLSSTMNQFRDAADRLNRWHIAQKEKFVFFKDKTAKFLKDKSNKDFVFYSTSLAYVFSVIYASYLSLV